LLPFGQPLRGGLIAVRAGVGLWAVAYGNLDLFGSFWVKPKRTKKNRDEVVLFNSLKPRPKLILRRQYLFFKKLSYLCQRFTPQNK
jgi:hypothetical protein